MRINTQYYINQNRKRKFCNSRLLSIWFGDYLVQMRNNIYTLQSWMGCFTSAPVRGPEELKDNKHAPVNKQQSCLQMQWSCPNCRIKMPKGTTDRIFYEHIDMCVVYADQEAKNINNLIGVGQTNSKYIYKKKLNDDGVGEEWEKIVADSSSIFKVGFEAKQLKLRRQIEKSIRISWEKGYKQILIDKKNILLDAIKGFKNTNLRGEIKIKFKDEKANDAGGLLRQLIHLVNKQLFQGNLKIFKKADTSEPTYKLQRSIRRKIKQQKNNIKEILFFYGQVIGKCILQRIPQTFYLDRTVLRQLCGQQVTEKDMHSFDQNLYRSWKYMLQNNIQQENESGQFAQFFYTVLEEDQNGQLIEVPIVTNGNSIRVTQKNKRDYIDKSINFLAFQRVSNEINLIKNGLNSVIPEKYLNQFEPHQFQMVLYGTPFIDLEDWENNTEYRGAYSKRHKNIMWFWKFMRSQTQQKLAKLLHFSTGSTRVPFSGFQKLQSNRGEVCKFTIQSCEWKPNGPYPKGHTCFNRLELPVYPKQSQLIQFLTFILNAELDGILGLD